MTSHDTLPASRHIRLPMISIVLLLALISTSISYVVIRTPFALPCPETNDDTLTTTWTYRHPEDGFIVDLPKALCSSTLIQTHDGHGIEAKSERVHVEAWASPSDVQKALPTLDQRTAAWQAEGVTFSMITGDDQAFTISGTYNDTSFYERFFTQKGRTYAVRWVMPTDQVNVMEPVAQDAIERFTTTSEH